MHTNILYEDDNLLIIEKSAIIPSYNESTEAEDLLNALKEHMKKVTLKVRICIRKLMKYRAVR